MKSSLAVEVAGGVARTVTTDLERRRTRGASTPVDTPSTRAGTEREDSTRSIGRGIGRCNVMAH